MKKIFLALCASFLLVAFAFALPSDERREKAARCYGKIRIVKSLADFDVKVVDSLADLDVVIVDSFPDSPGKWKIVDGCADYDVRFVDGCGDFSVRFVDSFPGVR